MRKILNFAIRATQEITSTISLGAALAAFMMFATELAAEEIRANVLICSGFICALMFLFGYKLTPNEEAVSELKNRFKTQ